MRTRKRARPIPGTVGLVFGGLWGTIAASALPPHWHAPATAASAAVTALLVLLLWRRAGPSGGGNALFGRRTYYLAVATEVAAIYAAAILLPRTGLQGYFFPVCGVIVGLHFIGLWKATGSRHFLAITAGMCGASILAMAMPELSGAIHLRDLVAGLGNALVLWIAASRSPSTTQNAVARQA